VSESKPNQEHSLGSETAGIQWSSQVYRCIY